MEKLQGHGTSQALHPVTSASWFIQPVSNCSDIVLIANKMWVFFKKTNKLVDMWGCVQPFMAAHDSEESNGSPNQRVAGSELRQRITRWSAPEQNPIFGKITDLEVFRGGLFRHHGELTQTV